MFNVKLVDGTDVLLVYSHIFMFELYSYSDLMWEPGLWSVDTKIHFIREVYWCIDSETERENILKSINSLGLKSCITKFGFTDKETNLFDSVIF